MTRSCRSFVTVLTRAHTRLVAQNTRLGRVHSDFDTYMSGMNDKMRDLHRAVAELKEANEQKANQQQAAAAAAAAAASE